MYLVLLALLGCESRFGAPCSSSDECGRYVCHDGVCTTRCEGEEDCPAVDPSDPGCRYPCDLEVLMCETEPPAECD